jgi:hypothetical protein
MNSVLRYVTGTARRLLDTASKSLKPQQVVTTAEPKENSGKSTEKKDGISKLSN